MVAAGSVLERFRALVEQFQIGVYQNSEASGITALIPSRQPNAKLAWSSGGYNGASTGGNGRGTYAE